MKCSTCAVELIRSTSHIKDGIKKTEYICLNLNCSDYNKKKALCMCDAHKNMNEDFLINLIDKLSKRVDVLERKQQEYETLDKPILDLLEQEEKHRALNRPKFN